MPDIYVHEEIYRLRDHRVWCEAVALSTHGRGVISHYSAAFLWGADLLAPDAPVSISVPTDARFRPHSHRSTTRVSLPPADVTETAGIVLTTPLRTAFDLGRQRSRIEAVIALDTMCRRRLVTIAMVHDYIARHGAQGGVSRLRTRLPEVEPLCESPMETRLRLLLRDGGAPAPRAQFEVRAPTGHFIARVDLAYPQWRIALEYDGDHHRERVQFRRDVQRLNALRAAGWIVLRFTADDVLRHPSRVLQHVAQAIKERA